PLAQLPGFPAGVEIAVGSFDVNRHEDLVFGASYYDGNLVPQGVWLMRNGQITLVTRTSLPAPGAPVGATFDYVSGQEINDVGEIVFDAGLTTGSGLTLANRGGIWFTHNGELKYLMRYGDHAPGTPAETQFGNGQFAGSPSHHDINNRGQIAFFSRLQLNTG